METLTVMVTFDLKKVNDALGNTPNVSARDALEALLNSAIHHYGLTDDYWQWDSAPHLEDHVKFLVL